MKTLVKILTLFALVSTACESEISEKQSDYFIKFYGDYQIDNASKIYPAKDGGYIIIGTSMRDGRQTDIILIKTDKYGNQASWSPKYFGGDKDDNGRDLIVLEDGYLLAGSTTNENNNLDSYIVRTDERGDSIWTRTMGKVYDDEAMTIIQKQDGGFIFAGYSMSNFNQKKVYIQPLDASGNPLPASERGQQDEQILKLIEENETTYIALGTKLENDQQFFVLKVNSVGNDFANVTLGIENRNEFLSDAELISDDNALYILGTSYDNDNENGEIYLTRINSVDLTEEWSKRIGTKGSYTGNAIAMMGDDKLLIAGEREEAGNKNIVVYITDLEGNIIQDFEYGGSGDQTAKDIYYFDNQILVLGNNLLEGNSMITLMKIDEEGNLWN